MGYRSHEGLLGASGGGRRTHPGKPGVEPGILGDVREPGSVLGKC